MRDYVQWHRAYDDPDSSLSWRLRKVQAYLREALDERAGTVRLVSACSGDGRDVIGVLRERDDAARVTATLIELHPNIAQAARDAAQAASLTNVEVRVADAGSTDAYVGAVPADVVLLVGIFGNISDRDIERTIRTAPQLCVPDATLIWSRGRDWNDRNDDIRRWFADARFAELDYATLESASRPALGAMRYTGTPQPLSPAQRLFTFLR